MTSSVNSMSSLVTNMTSSVTNMTSSFGDIEYWEVRIQDPVERYIWAAYFLIMVLSSFLGDSLILVATIKYRAIKYHKLIVTIIQHMAMCDLLTSLSALFGPISMIADGQVLGTFICYVSTYIVYLTFPASFLLISAITSSKILLLKYPLRCNAWRTSTAHLICGACWFCAATVPLSLLAVDYEDIIFNFKSYKCDYHFSAPIWKWLRPLLSIYTSLLPNIVVVITAVMLLFEARRVAKRGRGTLRWHGIITVVLTAVIYCITILPFTFYLIAGPHISEQPPGAFHLHFYRTAWSILILSVVSNFYIYVATIPSFRHFVCSYFRRKQRGNDTWKSDGSAFIH